MKSNESISVRCPYCGKFNGLMAGYDMEAFRLAECLECENKFAVNLSYEIKVEVFSLQRVPE